MEGMRRGKKNLKFFHLNHLKIVEGGFEVFMLAHVRLNTVVSFYVFSLLLIIVVSFNKIIKKYT